MFFLLLKHMLLLAEAAWMHAGVCPLNALMSCENLTGDTGRISLACVFVHKAEEMQLSTAEITPDMQLTYGQM